MRLVLAEPAERDLISIIDYIALDDPSAAERVYEAIAAAMRRLLDFPEMGRPGRLPDTREIRVPSLPYLLVYDVAADLVTILAIFHTARDLTKALAERKDTLKSWARSR